MTATTKLDLELLQNGAANQTLANETFHQLNQLVQAGVVDRATTPPGSPANEDLYLIIATATGAWAGKENQLAYWLTSTAAWQYVLPREGMLVHVNDEDVYYKYTGSAWAVLSTGGATLPVVQALSSTRNLALADINTFNVNSTTNNYVVTIPPQSSVVWTADAEIHFLPSNTGDITITGGTGVSVNGVVAGSVTLSTQYGAASLKRIAADSWWVGGVLGDDLTVKGPASSTDNNLPLFDGATGKLLKDSGTTVTAAGRALLDDASAAAQCTTLGLGTGNSPTFTALTLSNGQLVFPVTQVPSADANTLDDYEEGTWTPVLTFATPGNLNVVYSNQAGKYTKIGRFVSVAFLIQTSTFTHTTASGVMRVTGFPFTVGTGLPHNIGTLHWSGVTKASYTSHCAIMLVNTTNMETLSAGSGQATSQIMAADMPTGGTVRLDLGGQYTV